MSDRKCAGALALIASMVIIAVLASPASASQSLETPNWDRTLAEQSARSTSVRSEVDSAVALVSENKKTSAFEALREMSLRSDWSQPARDRAMFEFARALADFSRESVPESIVDFLVSYQAKTLVPHEEAAEIGVALFPVSAAIGGILNQWRAQAAHIEALALVRSDPETLLARYAVTNDHAYRRGVRSGISSASPKKLNGLIRAGLLLLPEMPELTGLVGTATLARKDAEAFAQVVSQGGGAELLHLLREAPNAFNTADLEAIRSNTLGQAAPETRALINAEFERLQTDEPVPMADGSIESWTEEDGVLGLGYPVPIPVDNSMPFDGFRTYNGLHTRHQQLMSDTDIVHGEVVNQTHQGNDIWAYRIGDENQTTWEGLPEPATLTNGGIHAREWQTPEVVTGIMELFADREGDNHYYDFLLENVNMIIIPVQNVDGFLQTQRYPSQNYLGTNPDDIEDDPFPSPRDGRMRRKNMRDVDTNLETEADHLLGIDLNRNNAPLWATDPNRSSGEPASIVYHGESAFSEPEAQALLAAADLGPANQLRLYNDVHSFSQVFYYHRTRNIGLSNHVVSLMNNQANFNAALPNGSLYLFNPDPNLNIDAGFGMTNEYFTTELEVASYGIEVEPNQGGQFFNNEPPCGGNYGGFARNCHDGFILPESEIRRVRENLAQSISANFYQQAGPPSISAVRIVDAATQAVVYEAEWDPISDTERQLYEHQVMPVQLGREYIFWVGYDRPMRWRTDGAVSVFPGQPGSTLNFNAGSFVDDTELTGTTTNERWLNSAGGAPDGYFRYQDDAFATEFVFDASGENLNLVAPLADSNIRTSTTNMTGQALDTDPSTPITWSGGGWAGWEDNNGSDSNTGGTDASYMFEVSSDEQPDPFVVEPGTSAAWFDIANDGEGFMIEILENNRAVMYWFTYDEEGEQAWYIAVGEVRGNRLLFEEVLRTSGGVFGPGFDPDTVVTTTVGTANFLYESCDAGTMVYTIDGRKGRFNLQRLSTILGVECGGEPDSVPTVATRSGSWFTASQSGHGFVVEVLDNGQALVYWFTYDLEGNQAWFFGIGTVDGDALTISETFATSGPRFGPDFNPDDLELIDWGTLEFSLGCTGGGVNYNGSLAGYPAASLPLSRLSVLAGLSCN